MKYGIILTCKEALAYDGKVITKDGAKRIVVRESEGWVPCTTSSIGDDQKDLPRDTMTFSSREEATQFGDRMDEMTNRGECGWHPWYAMPKNWEVVALEPATETRIVGWEITK